MKKLLLSTLAILILAGVSWSEPAPIDCQFLIGAQTIAASGVVPQQTPTHLIKNEGYFSVQATFTGSGALTIGYQVRNSDLAPWSPEVEIIAGAVTGTVYPYPAAGVNIFAGQQRIVLTETTTTDTIVLTGVYRCIQ